MSIVGPGSTLTGRAMDGGDVWTALGQVGYLLAEAERAFLNGDYRTSDRLLAEAEEMLAVARDLQRSAEDVLFETPLLAAPDTGSIVDAAVRVVTTRGPFAFVDVTLSARGAAEGLAPEEEITKLEIRRPVR